MSLALKLALAPLLVAQAIATRRRALVLPEAGGPREGRVGPPQGAPLRLLIAGDSSAAGVGVARQCDAVAGYLTRTLHQRLDIPVAWALRARSGLTTLQVHDLLKAEPAPPVDVAVVITGVNDVIDQVPTRRAVRQREALAAWLLDEGRARHVLFAPLPPIHRFPCCRSRCGGRWAPTRAVTTKRWHAGRARARMCRTSALRSKWAPT